jgi:hypothetical protein
MLMHVCVCVNVGPNYFGGFVMGLFLIALMWKFCDWWCINVIIH